MRTPVVFLFLVPLAFGLTAVGQNSPQSAPGNPPQSSTAAPPQGRSPGGDIGSGSGNIGKGVGEGAGKAAEGVGKGAGDLVTLHPAGAAENVGKGAGEAGKDIGVGTVKGTGKIGKGTGKLIAKPFHHSKKVDGADTTQPSNASLH